MRKVPNILSIFRICLVPLFIVVYFLGSHSSKLPAALVYALAAFSDFLDGYLARKYNASSNLGKVLDPLGDKLMTVSVMTCITIDGIIPYFAVLIAGIKEILMAIGGLVIHKIARVEIPPSNILGKMSTVVFFVVCVTLMLLQLSDIMAIILISAAITLTIISLVSYVFAFIALMKTRERT